MPYTITILPSAASSLKPLPEEDRRRVVRKIEGLADDPRPPQARILTSKERFWRLRVGDYRVIYRIDDQRKQVLVLVIGHRREIYRKV